MTRYLPPTQRYYNAEVHSKLKENRAPSHPLSPCVRDLVFHQTVFQLRQSIAMKFENKQRNVI